MREQRRPPGFGRNRVRRVERQVDIGIDECDEGGVHMSTAFVAGCGRTTIHCETRRSSREQRNASVIDRDPPVARHHAAELWRHHRDVCDSVSVGRTHDRVDRTGVEESICQTRDHIVTGLDVIDDECAGIRHAEHAERRACQHHAAAVVT